MLHGLVEQVGIVAQSSDQTLPRRSRHRLPVPLE
jgi:hypothetical protein